MPRIVAFSGSRIVLIYLTGLPDLYLIISSLLALPSVVSQDSILNSLIFLFFLKPRIRLNDCKFYFVQAQASTQAKELNLAEDLKVNYDYDPLKIVNNSQSLKADSDEKSNIATGSAGAIWCGVPQVIYTSRTHSQLTQVMQELKRSAYNHMKAIALGSRDQLCIHPEVSKETNNSAKIQMCKLHILTNTCSFYKKVDSIKNNPQFQSQTVMDIEDLVTIGHKLKVCPYYSSKESTRNADIIFMPYNYLLDPKARKANNIFLSNTIVILDEAHNVEKMCEEAASIQMKSSDIALCVADVTDVMKSLAEDMESELEDRSDPNQKDFSIEDLALLKEMLLDLEKAIDGIQISALSGGTTFPGGYIFEILAKANITHQNQGMINRLLESLIQFLTAASQKNSAFRKGAGLQILADLLAIVFTDADSNNDEKVRRCFKVHVEIEESKQQKPRIDCWLPSKSAETSKTNAKVINYWCFNPGYGMQQLLEKRVRSIILTSGTLAPLTPLIAELAIPISVRLENPHIVGKSQVCVKIVPFGPDKVPLNSNYQNRDNPKYISSLGRTILSFCPIIPDGLLVFFPSYPLMNKCAEAWQASGLWSQINRHKPIFVEPRGKDAFNTTMSDFYEKINDPSTRGACFMAVCRGKVSEGLDFADVNGRAVIITGLPYPPLKDSRIILKREYLDTNRTKENELLSGEAWYGLEAIRAINQAIGRVIRHKNDYGAILLCDSRFLYSLQRFKLSTWVQSYLDAEPQNTSFGQFIRDISRFFRNAANTLPKLCLRELNPVVFPTIQEQNIRANTAEVEYPRTNLISVQAAAIQLENSNQVSSWHPSEYKSIYDNVVKSNETRQLDFISRLDEKITTIDFNKTDMDSQSGQSSSQSSSQVTIYKREPKSPVASTATHLIKRRKIKLVSNNESLSHTSCTSTSNACGVTTPNDATSIVKTIPLDRTELLKLIKNALSPNMYTLFVKTLMTYQKDDQFNSLMEGLVEVFRHPTLHYLLKGMRRFVKERHKDEFDAYLHKMKSL